MARPEKKSKPVRKPRRSARRPAAAPNAPEPEVSALPEYTAEPATTRRTFRYGYLIAVVVALVGLILLTNRGLLLAAVVNGHPIYRWDLNRVLMSRFGQQTLDNMITERLISDEAAKNKIAVSQSEIDAKEQDIVKSFGGKVSVDELLKFQGLTKADFDDQVRMQLVVSKLLGKDIKVDDKEITAFIDKNKDTLTATDEAGLRSEAKDALFNQKVSDKVQAWFTDIRSKAKIVKFLQ